MNLQLYDINGPIDAIREDTAITVGVFDGVHRGHRHLLEQLSSHEPHLAPLAVTLTSHPSFVLGRRDSEYWLDDPEEHLSLLFDAGVKYVAVLPFTKEVSQLSACQMARQLYNKLNSTPAEPPLPHRRPRGAWARCGPHTGIPHRKRVAGEHPQDAAQRRSLLRLRNI